MKATESYQDVSKNDFAKHQEHQAEEQERDDVQRNVEYSIWNGWRIQRMICV